MKKYYEIDYVKRNQKLEHDLKQINLVRNQFAKGSKIYNYEMASDFYLVQPHDNDLYVQN